MEPSTLPRLAGKRIAVIGTAPGQIGGAIAHRLVAEGAELILGGRNPDRARTVAESVSGPGAVRGILEVNLADSESVEAFITASAETLGGLDGLVNNAAQYTSRTNDADAVEVDLASFDELLQVNLRGHLLAVRYAIPHLQRAGGGSIVLTSSMAGLLGEPTRVSYGLAKAGLLSLARHVAARWGKQGIRCNAIVPGRIVTGEPVDERDAALRNAFLRIAASPRLGRPEDIAAAAAYLVSDDAAFINGSSLVIDGGMSSIFAPAPMDDDDFIDRYPFSKHDLGFD